MQLSTLNPQAQPPVPSCIHRTEHLQPGSPAHRTPLTVHHPTDAAGDGARAEAGGRTGWRPRRRIGDGAGAGAGVRGAGRRCDVDAFVVGGRVYGRPSHGWPRIRCVTVAEIQPRLWMGNGCCCSYRRRVAAAPYATRRPCTGRAVLYHEKMPSATSHVLTLPSCQSVPPCRTTLNQYPHTLDQRPHPRTRTRV